MTTWTNFAAGRGAAVTSWTYDPGSGQLSSKADASNHVFCYWYTEAGQLWESGSARGISTDYSCNAGGDVSGVVYSDWTPPLSFYYDRPVGNQ
jgi:hypothetical protein